MLKECTIPEGETKNIMIQDNCNNLSLIQEKHEDNSNNVSLVNNIKITRNKKSKIFTGKRIGDDLNFKLEKALNDFKEWKDKFLKDKEAPIKANASFGGLYSPSNRLKTAPYQPKKSFGSSIYSPTMNKNFKTIYNGIPKSPNPNEKSDLNFTIDVNGIPHSVKMSGTETTGKTNYCKEIDETNNQAKEIAELKEKIYVSEMLLKKLYWQNQELVEKVSSQQDKITKMDLDHRTLQKQHLLLQHNIQNKIMGKLFKSTNLFSHSSFKCEPKHNGIQEFTSWKEE